MRSVTKAAILDVCDSPVVLVYSEPYAFRAAKVPASNRGREIMRKWSIIATIASFALVVAPITATVLPASASVPECAPGLSPFCIAITSDLFSRDYVLESYQGNQTAGSKIILRRLSGSDPSEAFWAHYDGTVGALGLELGLFRGSPLLAKYSTDRVYEFVYYPAPDSGLCLGATSASAVNGTTVALEPCGVGLATLWVADGPLGRGFVPLISGASRGRTAYALSMPVRVKPGSGQQLVTSTLTPSADYQLWGTSPLS
jgi:hypothetical protein